MVIYMFLIFLGHIYIFIPVLNVCMHEPSLYDFRLHSCSFVHTDIYNKSGFGKRVFLFIPLTWMEYRGTCKI